MIEYALLVGLIAVVAVVGVAFLGTSVSNLFTHANSCVSTQGDTSTQSGTSQLSIANSQMSSQLGSGNQLSTGQRINSGHHPTGRTSLRGHGEQREPEPAADTPAVAIDALEHPHLLAPPRVGRHRSERWEPTEPSGTLTPDVASWRRWST